MLSWAKRSHSPKRSPRFHAWCPVRAPRRERLEPSLTRLGCHGYQVEGYLAPSRVHHGIANSEYHSFESQVVHARGRQVASSPDIPFRIPDSGHFCHAECCLQSVSQIQVPGGLSNRRAIVFLFHPQGYTGKTQFTGTDLEF
jgi:hypothetical protein